MSHKLISKNEKRSLTKRQLRDLKRARRSDLDQQLNEDLLQGQDNLRMYGHHRRTGDDDG